jgi:pimeloyl-ACP methyl ester carboxylesterase
VEHLKAVLAEVLLDDDEHQTREDGIVIVGHSFGSLVAFELARVLNAQGPANQENEEAPADKTSSAEFPLLSEVPAARHCGVKVKGVALLAMPFYEEPGDASRGLKRTPKGCFVAGLINCPGAAFILCTLICQQRWLWLPLYRALRATLVAVGAVAVVVPEQRQGGGPAAGSSSSTSDAATDAVEDFMLHSFYSCMETFNAINQHRVLTETKATGAFADRIAVDIIRDENRTQMLSLSTTTLAPELGLLTSAAPPTTPTANAAISLLLVHGALDDIVPVERSKSFVEALQSRGLLVPPASSFAGGGDGNPTKLRGSSPSSSVHFANKFDVHLEVLPDADHALASHPEHASSTIVAIERWICLLKS